MSILFDFWDFINRYDLKLVFRLQSEREVTSCGRFTGPRTPNYSRNWMRLNFVKNVGKTVNFMEWFVLLPPGFQESFVLCYKTKMIWDVSLVYITYTFAQHYSTSPSVWKTMYFFCHLYSQLHIPSTVYNSSPPEHVPCSPVQYLVAQGSLSYIIRKVFFLYKVHITSIIHNMKILFTCISYIYGDNDTNASLSLCH